MTTIVDISPIAWACLALTALSVTLWLVVVVSTWLSTRRPVATLLGPAPPVSLLKPLAGLEEQLEANLRSFFEQRYPGPWEMVFVSTDADDPALALARQLAAEYPRVATRFVLANRGTGLDPTVWLNPKVRNMEAARRAARFDLLLQTDANVRARPGFLRDVVAEYRSSSASLVGLLVAGTGEASIGAALESFELTADITGLMCTAERLTEVVCVVGKGFLIDTATLAAVGGLARVRDVLAEDFVLGEAVRASGRGVALARTSADNVNVDHEIGAFLSRYTRWLTMRRVISPPAFVAGLLVNPTVFGLVTWLACGLNGLVGLGWLGLVAAKALVDRALVGRVRGEPMAWRWVIVGPLGDLLIAAVWLRALFGRTTSWRGRRFRLGKGSRLLPVSRSDLKPAATDVNGTFAAPRQLA